MRLALQLGYDDPLGGIALAQEADRLGFHSVWTSEAYGTDAVTPMAWLAATTERIAVGSAIMQMPARSPATTAATVATLDILSGGRVLLGLGTSGPQVAEGWHGQAWGKPLTRTREYVEIVRTILRREEPLEHHGEHYDIPYSGPDATGLGKPLKIIVHPVRHEVPIYLAAIGPKNVALTAEIADGWLPIFFSPERAPGVHGPALEEGFARRGGRPEGWDLAPLVPVVMDDDVQACRDFLRPMLALYVGGMGARGQNFYTRLAQRYGFEAEAAEIQDHYLAGRKGDAAAAVPDALVDEIALVGGRDRIADRLAAWRESDVTTLVLQARQPEALQALAGARGLKEAVKDAVDEALGQALGTVVTQATQLAGGASKEAWAVTTADGRELLLRRAGGGVIHVDTLSLRDEFAVISAAREAGVRVPEPIAYLGDLDGRESFVMELVHGETIGRRIVKAPPPGLDVQMADELAKVHSIPASALPQLPAPDLWPRLYAELDLIDEPHPAIELGLVWCQERLPLERPRVVNHGDFRVGNLMVDESGLVAVLDWEFAHLSDPAEDLAWPLVRAWRFGRDELRLGGIGAVGPYLERYAELTGVEVPMAELLAWEVLGNCKWAIGALNQSRRHLQSEERSVELAILGRLAAEMELELLDLIEKAP